MRSRSAANEAGRTLIATSRPIRGSRARYTSPMPPAPSNPTISYSPILVPGVSLKSEAYYDRRRSLERRIGQREARRFPALDGVDIEEHAGDSRRALHIARLGNNQVGLHSVFCLRPSRAVVIAHCGNDELFRHAPREHQIFPVTVNTIEIEKKA